MNIRSFIAIEISDEAREELSRIIGEFKKADADVKWVKPESVHLTLKFLGSVPEEKIPAISERLKSIASQTAPFDMALSGFGVFPKWDYVKVLWVGMGAPTEGGSGADEIKMLAEKIEEEMAQEGFEKEKREFSSHLTVGRPRSAKNKDKLKQIASTISVKPVPMHVSRVILFKSDLSPTGSIYTPLETAEFLKKET